MTDKFWMTCREDGGCPLKRHSTKEKAEKAAKSLALNQGVQYFILELIGAAEPPKPQSSE